MSDKPLRAVLYGRCSSQKQADRDLSVPAQLEHCRAHAKRKGWVVVGEYRDDGISGFEDERRPDFRRMLADMVRQPRPFDVIVVWDYSRFSRSLEHSIRASQDVRAAGVQLESTKEQVDDTPAGWLMGTIFRSFNEFQVRKLADDTRRGMRKNAEQGNYNGGVVPIGYRVERGDGKKGGVLVPDPQWAPLVRRIFGMALAGTGSCAIAGELNDEGLRTKQGRRWSKQSVLVVLRNEKYTGTAIWGESQTGKFANDQQPVVRVESAHEALVSKDDFARIQALIESRDPTVLHPRTAAGDYLLSGLLRCETCGAAYIGHGAKKGTHHYYTCRTKMTQGAKACTAKNFNRERAEATVIDAVRDHILKPEHFAELVREVQADLRASASHASDKRAVIVTQLGEINKKLERLYEAVESGTIPYARLADRIEQWSIEREELNRKLTELPREEANPVLAISPEGVAAWVASLREVFARGTTDEQRALLRAWVRRVTADGDKLTIEYTFPMVGVDGDGGPDAGVGLPAPTVLGPTVDESLGAKGWFAPDLKTSKGELPWWRVLPTVVNGSRCWT